MKLGIVGLPNVGKSTLFNSLTKAGALSANYPFATIDPNIGIVSVPDERIVKLGELYHTKKVTPATIEFVDIAGLVKGASKGEGLGNQFLANIREVDAIVHVVRCFEDTNIIHVDGSIDPARDIETINLELIFSDIEILDRRIAKIAKQARMDKTLAKELELVEAVKAHLEDGKMARSFEVPDDEDAQIWFKGYNLLTAKPTIYAANVAEDDLADDGASNPHVAKVRDGSRRGRKGIRYLCADRAGTGRTFRGREEGISGRSRGGIQRTGQAGGGKLQYSRSDQLFDGRRGRVPCMDDQEGNQGTAGSRQDSYGLRERLYQGGSCQLPGSSGQWKPRCSA